jgi:predicted ester cyclase
MSIETTADAMNAYWAALEERGDYGRYLTDDVTFAIEGTDQKASGRNDVVQMIRWFHEQAFDAAPELKNLVIGDGSTAAEADFVGKHIGEFGGIAATGRSVRVPYAVLYDFDDGKISSVRLYMALDMIAQQLA